MKRQSESGTSTTRKSKVTKTRATVPATKVVTRTPRKVEKTELAKQPMPSTLAAPKPVAKPATGGARKTSRSTGVKARPANHTAHVTRVGTTAAAAHRQIIRMARSPQFTYMKAPGVDDAFDVGDTVEVFCDHERNSERVRGWIKGIVVQVDNKLVAVQFRSNVFLTDGWMVPDRILWYSLTSDQIRPATFAKRGSRKVIPDY
jgi:hypothetical protein